MMLLSWFVITNHCALARLTPRQTAEEDVPPCHRKKHAPEEKDTPCQEMTLCCKVKAALPGKAEVKFDASQFEIQVFAVLQVLAAEVARPVPAVPFDHGPPRAVSFAESVLQRSLLSHAPPFAA